MAVSVFVSYKLNDMAWVGTASLEPLHRHKARKTGTEASGLLFLSRDTGVVTAKAEGVANDAIDFYLPRSVRHVIQIAFGVGHNLIDRGGNRVSFDGFCADCHLDSASRSDSHLVRS